MMSVSNEEVPLVERGCRRTTSLVPLRVLLVEKRFVVLIVRHVLSGALLLKKTFGKSDTA